MSDTAYWAARRREEDRVLVSLAQAHSRRYAEELAAIAAGLRPGRPDDGGDYYTARWAEWSRRWHDAGCPAPGVITLPTNSGALGAPE